MTKSLQVRVSKEQIDSAVKNYINKRIKEICKQQKIDEQVFIEVEEAIIEVRIRGYDEKIKDIEERLQGVEGSKKNL